MHGRCHATVPIPNAIQFNLFPTRTGGLSPTARMIANPSFGFGRRICPGRFSADSALWAAFAQILGTVRFSKVEDADGQPIEINPEFTTGITSQSLPFRFSITRV